MNCIKVEIIDSKLKALMSLLEDCVESGASVGFLHPLGVDECERYWLGINPLLKDGSRILLVVEIDDKIVGSVQASFCHKKNGLHRAEVEKLMVHRSYRGRGIGRKLLNAIEVAIRERNCWLIVLDTRVGDVASRLYRSAGYIEAGQIPSYALSSSGSYEATAFFYKRNQ